MVKDIRKQGLKALKYLQDIDKDDVLEAIGLEERSSPWATALGTFGIFALGCLVGAGIGLAFAPKPMPNWMVNSRVLPYAMEASSAIASLAPNAIKNAFRDSMLELRRLWNEQLIQSREQLRVLERGVTRPEPRDKNKK